MTGVVSQIFGQRKSHKIGKVLRILIKNFSTINNKSFVAQLSKGRPLLHLFSQRVVDKVDERGGELSGLDVEFRRLVGDDVVEELENGHVLRRHQAHGEAAAGPGRRGRWCSP